MKVKNFAQLAKFQEKSQQAPTVLTQEKPLFSIQRESHRQCMSAVISIALLLMK